MISARFPFGLMRFLHPDGEVRDKPAPRALWEAKWNAEIKAGTRRSVYVDPYRYHPEPEWKRNRNEFKRLMRDTE